MKEKVSISQVISDLKNLFKIGEQNGFASSENQGKFMIDKRIFERLQIISMLQEYFSDKLIDGGYLIVDSITFVYTTFEVKAGKPDNM